MDTPEPVPDAAMLISSMVLHDIRDEARRAHDKRGLYSIYWATATGDRRMTVLAEEAGEVARALNDFPLDLAHLRAGLVQVAAVAATTIQAIDDGNA